MNAEYKLIGLYNSTQNDSKMISNSIITLEQSKNMYNSVTIYIK